MAMAFGPRRGVFVDVGALPASEREPLSPQELEAFEALDLVYRAACAILYNYVPMSGHPGGSISSGRFVAGLLFDAMDYDLSRPERDDADVVSYAAGHKAMGLYSLWALRDEVARLGAPELLPDVRQRLRLEDLLGFRRNPVTSTPLFARVRAKALDGHPTPATPFVRLATGASGVGLASSVGLALAARDYYGADAPRVHVVEGEGGLTPGRAAEALAAAGTASLDNVVVHLDWNQASIDSDHVCRDEGRPGDYVQWSPQELFHLHDWNVILVPDGLDFQQVIAAQRAARRLDSGQPTAIVYRTVKGWRYGVSGRASHGAGHKLCSAGFYEAVGELLGLRRRQASELRTGQATLRTCRGRQEHHGGVLLDGARHPAEPPRGVPCPYRRDGASPAGRAGPARPASSLSAAGRATGGGRLRDRGAPGTPRPGGSGACPRHADDAAGRAGTGSASSERGVGWRPARRGCRPSRLDQRQRRRRRLHAWILERAHQPGRPPALHRRHLRGRHRRSPLGNLEPTAATWASARPTARSSRH